MELRLHHSLIAAAVLTFAARADVRPLSNQVIKQFPLDERTVYEVPISRDSPTTLMFPSAISGLEGANVSASPDNPAPVLLAYTPGRYFFSVRALEPNAHAGVNVIWKNKTYVIRFAAAERPYASVTFYEDELAGRSVSLQRRVTPEVLLGLLDRAKSFGLVQTQYPEAVQQIERTTPGSVSLYQDFKVIVEEIFRFDPEDTLVFRVRFESTGDKEVIYQPQRLAVRVGEDLYYASIADASGIVPPKGTTSAYFAITGTPRGGRANLSPKNAFSIVVPRVDRDAKLVIAQ
jgi:hypothetical protein